jgi:hypothetical protein
MMDDVRAEIKQLKNEIEVLKQRLFIHSAVIIPLCAFHDTTIEQLMSTLAQNRYHPNTEKFYRPLAELHGVNYDEFFDAIEELNPWWPFKDTPEGNEKGGE